eukprot:TRINITY_DN33279_c0_g1_i1.p1 TRINITY_DN33279_c0_g1~~TRINITY_DN33279_c0_g1_i1.p1  ORF type:complete len:1382 (-),score=287.48 TRINITY_DN33279_c0_g1_i1:47-4192(-)
MSFFKNGISKLMGTARTDAAQQSLPPYQGQLPADHFQLSEGVLLGPGAVVPQTLTHVPKAGFVAFCTTAGHVRLLGQEFEATLQNPSAPMHAEFLLFPRPGLVLLIGVVSRAEGSSASSSAGSSAQSAAGWVAQWWELGSSTISPSAQAVPPQAALLRFGVTCAAAASEETSLVFLGTDEGDVRVFDAGEKPQVGAYCVPWASLQPSRRAEASRPCPISAIAPAPQAVPELLIATGEGGLVLWSFEKHRVLRNFDSVTAVTSLVWHVNGSQFLAASRSDVGIFCRSSSSALARVALPGGPAGSVVLLRWADDAVNDATLPAVGPEAAARPLHGQVLLRRGAPSPAVLSLSGPGWAKVQSVFSEAGAVAGAVVCSTSTLGGEGPGNFCTPPPCGCPVFPSAASFEDSSPIGAGTPAAEASSLLGVLAVLGETGSGDCCRLAAALVGGPRRLSWPFSWGSARLAGATSIQMLPRDAIFQRTAQAADKPTDLSTELTAEPSDEAADAPLQTAKMQAILDGELLGGAVALPEDRPDIEAVDGWFVCMGPLDDEEQGEGVRWPLPLEATEIHCKLNLGLDAKAELVLWHDDGEEALLLDGADQRSSWRGQDESCQADIAPGIDHDMLFCVQAEDEEATGEQSEVLWDGEPLKLPQRKSRRRPKAVGWRCLEGELRLRSMFSRPSPSRSSDAPIPSLSEADGSDGSADPAKPAVTEEQEGHHLRMCPMELTEAMLAHHLAHFRHFIEGQEVRPAPRRFVSNWAVLAGGCQGFLCSGHRDGTVRIWLRSHSSLMLLHVLSVCPLPALPWRPRLDPKRHAAASETPSSLDVQAGVLEGWYDGVDSCPAFPAGDGSDNSQAPAVTAVVWEPAARTVVAGCSSGEVVLFCWQTEPSEPLSASELAEWRLQTLMAADGKETLDSGTSPELSSGFVCRMRLRQHQAAISLLRVVFTSGKLQILCADSTSRLSIVDGLSGEMLFSQFLDPHAAAAAESPSGGPRPPPETLGAVAVAGSILHVASNVSPKGEGTSRQFRPEPRSTDVVPSPQTNEMAEDVGAFILAMSSGEMRQLAAPAMKVLDSRIRETKLPQLPGGAVLALQLYDGFLLAVQSSAASVFMREANGHLHPTSHSTHFPKRAAAACTITVADEPCLLCLQGDGQLEVFALPSLQTLFSAPVGGKAGRALMGPSREGGSLGPAAGNCFCTDGYFALQGEGGGLWLSAALEVGSCRALDYAASAKASAELVQALRPGPSEPSSPGRAASGGSSGGGLLSNFFGLGSQPKTLRECAAPSQALPAEVDAARLDRSRGLGPAWRDPKAQRPPPPPPPPPAQQRASAVASVGDALAGASSRAVERGDKLKSLAGNSQKLSDDAGKFLDLAKQLNAQQNRWF